MKVLFVNPIGELGGAERSLLDLAWSLRRSAPEIELQLLAFAEGPLLAEAEKLGVPASVLPLPATLHRLGESGERRATTLARLALGGPVALGFVLELRRRMLDSGADIVHSNGLKSHVLAALARTGQPLIWHLRDFISRRPASRSLLSRLQGRVSCALAISSAVALDARPVLPRVSIERVLGAIRTEFFRPDPLPGVDLDALAGLPRPPADVVRVGLVATYGRWKGHELFLEAAAKLSETSVRFYLIGGPIYAPGSSQWSRNALEQRIKGLPIAERCGLVPFQAEMPSVYRALDIVVHASTEPEPFGRTVAEALASGTATIAAGAGGVLEQLTSGEQGLLFAPASADSLAASMAQLIRDPQLRKRLACSGREHAVSALDAGRLGGQVSAIYRAVAPEA